MGTESESVSHSLCLTVCDPMDCIHQAPLSMEFFRHEYWSGLPFPSPGDLSDPGIKPESPSLQAYSLLSEPPGESQKFVLCYLSILCPQNSPSKNTRVGSCSLLQGVFPTQGSNPGLLYCRRIIYQLSSVFILEHCI